MTDAVPEPFEWDEEVTVLVTLRVRAKPDAAYFDGMYERTPQLLAQNAAWQAGINDLSRADGWADLIGDVIVLDVQEG